MSKLDGHAELAIGTWGRIIGVRLRDGSCPAEDFLTGLDAAGQAQFRARFERLTAVGHLRSPDQFRQLQVEGLPKVYEIKAPAGPAWRLYVVPVKRDWIATHGCRKPKDKRVSIEVARAREIFREWER